MRRAGIVVLGLIYLLQASWLLEGGVDLLFPRFKVVTVDEVSCCSGACGCSTDKKSERNCCCYPKKKNPERPSSAQTPSKKVRLSAFEEANCKGTPAAMAALASHPAIPGPTIAPPAPQAAILIEFPTLTPPCPVQSTRLDRVPI